jgi:DNA-binding transcriptional ArsR family regulator
MVWRIHFTTEDLERIEVRPALGPLAETTAAMSLLRCPTQPRGTFRQWRSQVKDRVTPQMAPFSALIPLGTKGVDLAMLTGTAPTLEQGIQALLSMPSEDLLVEMEYIDQQAGLAAATWKMAEQGGEGRRQLAAGAVAAHRALVAPYWDRVHACLYAEHAARLRVLAARGPSALLASLQSQWVRWRPPVLEIMVFSELDIPLNGRGVVLLPSVFVGPLPGLHTTPGDPAAPPWLVMPPPGDRLEQSQLWTHSRSRGAALAALVGRNRAAVLRTVSEGCTTTELADRVGISIAAASQHASVLRNAGLITTHRTGSAVLHVLTPLGAELLRAG